MDEIRLEFSEIQNALSVLAKRGERAPHEVAPAAAEALHDQVLEVFETKGFGEWPPFWWQRDNLPKPSGRRWRGNPQLLQDTGLLVGSMTPAWADEYAEVFTDVPYAKYHASHRPRSVIPLRDFFAIDEASYAADVANMLLFRVASPSSVTAA